MAKTAPAPTWTDPPLLKKTQSYTIDTSIRQAHQLLTSALRVDKKLLSSWFIHVITALVIFVFLGRTSQPEFLVQDMSAIKNQQLVRYAIKGTLIYCLSWIIIMTIHEYYHNDFMLILKADNRQGYKRMVLLTLKLSVFYAVALWMPANHYANRLIAALLFYIWVSQKYVRTGLYYNWHSITKKKMQFVCNFSMNQATSLVFIISPLMAVLLPELPWLPGFVTLFPILCRFTQCFIVGTHEQFLNSIKFTLNLIGFGYSVVGMPAESHYWRIAAAIYSFYWDVFRDWKYKIRFYEKKDYRIHLPMRFLVAGVLFDIFGRSIWIIFPMVTQTRGIVEITRRVVWDLLRIEREQVFYYQRPEGNTVKDVDWFGK